MSRATAAVAGLLVGGVVTGLVTRWALRSREVTGTPEPAELPPATADDADAQHDADAGAGAGAGDEDDNTSPDEPEIESEPAPEPEPNNEVDIGEGQGDSLLIQNMPVIEVDLLPFDPSEEKEQDVLNNIQYMVDYQSLQSGLPSPLNEYNDELSPPSVWWAMVVFYSHFPEIPYGRLDPDNETHEPWIRAWEDIHAAVLQRIEHNAQQEPEPPAEDPPDPVPDPVTPPKGMSLPFAPAPKLHPWATRALAMRGA